MVSRNKPKPITKEDADVNWLPPGAKSLGVFRLAGTDGKGDPVVVEIQKDKKRRPREPRLR